MNINDTRAWLAASIRLGVMLLLGCLAQGAAAQKPAAPTAGSIKVGVLHSLSGTMAISETTLKDTVLMMIDEQNQLGGLLGKKLEAVVVDPASNWPLFAEKARELLQKEKVAVVFGCWTSVSRKSVLPVFEELNGLLFYPVQYEGEESSKNVFYTGAAPNQQAIPAVDYLMNDIGVKRWVLAGGGLSRIALRFIRAAGAVSSWGNDYGNYPVFQPRSRSCSRTARRTRPRRSWASSTSAPGMTMDTTRPTRRARRP